MEKILELIKEYVGDDTSDRTLEFLDAVKTEIDRVEVRDNGDSDESVLEEVKAEYEQRLADLDNEWREKYKARFFGEASEEVKDEQEDDVREDAEEVTYDDLFDEREV